MILTQMGFNFLVLTVTFGTFSTQQIFMFDNFGFILLSNILTTLFGLASVLIFLNAKLPPNLETSRNVSFDPKDFSIRKSIVDGTSFKMVTGGYTPTPKIFLENDGGIYMGEDEEDDVISLKVNEATAMERSDFMTSVSTRSIDESLPKHKIVRKDSPLYCSEKL